MFVKVTFVSFKRSPPLLLSFPFLSTQLVHQPFHLQDNVPGIVFLSAETHRYIKLELHLPNTVWKNDV